MCHHLRNDYVRREVQKPQGAILGNIMPVNRNLCDVTGRPQNECDVAPMTSSTAESCGGHVTDGDVASDVISNLIGDRMDHQCLLLGCIDGMTSLRAPDSKNIKVFVCSTGTGF